MNAELLIIYCTTIFIASIIPGPSMLLALTQGNRFGVVAGSLSAIGNVIASVMQGIIALLVIIQAGQVSPSLLFAIKLIGAAYIIYLGTALLSVRGFGNPSENTIGRGKAGPLRHCWHGFTFAILNPKALMFFAALFPQFVQNGPVTVQTMVAIFLPIISIAFVCFMLYVIAGAALFRILGASRHIGKVLGGSIILAGVALLLS